MGSLEELAREKFGELSEAERRVLRNAPNGTTADCRRDLGGGGEPEKADGTPKAPDEKWPDTRNVRADLIRWLCIDREAREQVDPRGVWIEGARITGRLDLSFTNVLFPLGMLGCRLDRLLNLRWAKMPTLNLGGSWTRAIAADGLNLEGNIFLRNGFHAEGEVRLLGATIGGDLDATGGTFKNPKGNALNADRAKISGSVFMKQGLDADGVVKNKFVAEGEVVLLGATIGGNLEADGGTFKNLKSDKNPNATGDALKADGINVTGAVFLRNDFSAEGEVRLLGATIGGDLDATRGTFKNPNRDALSADGIEAHGNAFLRDKFVADGQVRLHGAEITGQLEVDDAWLDALVLESAHVTGPFLWRKIHKDPHPDFPDKKWKPSLDLTNAKVGALVDEEASWPEKGGLRLDGFVYDRIYAGPTDAKAPTDARVPIDAAARLRWLGLQPAKLGFRPQPYEQLIAVLRQMGHEHQVAKVAIAKQWELRKHGRLGWWGWTKNCFLYLAVGYGYRAWLAFIWLLVLVVLGSCVFSRAHSANVLVPSEHAAYADYEKSKMEELTPAYPRFHALLYSLDVVSPFDLGQKSHWRLIESIGYWRYEFYSLFQLFFGWVLLLVAAAVPARFIKKD
jgi:hypothetical protein